MEINKKSTGQAIQPIKADFFERLWEESWSYIKTMVDVVHEPVLILDRDLRVMVANEPFYKTFLVKPKDTEGKVVYELGDGQWNIPALRKLLEDILPKNTFFKGFEVAHDFPAIGHKIMILNARQIYKENTTLEVFPPIILLAMEDITEMMSVAETISGHTKELEAKMLERTRHMETRVSELEEEISELKKKSL